MKDKRLDFLKKIVDECCDFYDDVAVVEVCPDQYIYGYRVELRTPAYGTFLVTKGYSLVVAVDDIDNWPEAKLIDFILSNVQKVHDDRNCSVRPNCIWRGTYNPYINNSFFNFDAISSGLPEIKDVMYHEPAVIVFWTDGTKTVVKAQEETFDPEKGLAMAFAKKILGNKGNYYNLFKKWLPQEPEDLGCSFSTLSNALARLNTSIFNGLRDPYGEDH